MLSKAYGKGEKMTGLHNEENKIRSMLNHSAADVELQLIPETTSTNDEMKKAARNGRKEISVLVAKKQTMGKGRKGRSFYSPADTGCYISFLLRPDFSAEECTLLTTMAAAVTATAIENVTGISTQIKWINDIYIDGRKVAGILTEGAVSPKGDTMDWAVVGIGINLAPPENGFPDEISDIAACVLSEYNEDVKHQLIAEIINLFTKQYRTLPEKSFLKEYKKRIIWLGEKITVHEGDSTFDAVALDIDSMGRLTVKTPDKAEKTLYGGEITIRKTNV